jgi:hypothetical protein
MDPRSWWSRFGGFGFEEPPGGAVLGPVFRLVYLGFLDGGLEGLDLAIGGFEDRVAAC